MGKDLTWFILDYFTSQKLTFYTHCIQQILLNFIEILFGQHHCQVLHWILNCTWICTCLLYLVSAVLHLVIIYESCENKSPFIFYEQGQKRGKYSWSIMSENHAYWVISVNITQSCDDGESQDVSIRTALSMMLFHYCSRSSCLYLHVFFFFIPSILELVLV